MGSISLHPKHGVNPSVGVCAFCGEDDGTVLLLGANRGKEAPRRMIGNPHEPCDACKAKMATGIAFIEAIKHERFQWVPGCWCVVKRDAEFLKNINPPELRDHILARGMALVPSEDWEAMGFKREK